MRIGKSASLARGTKRPAAPTRSPSEPRSDYTDVPEVPACKRSSRVRTPAAKVLSMILPEPSTAHDPAKADASALVDAATAVATDDINLTSTGSISQFLKGLEQLDDGDEDSPAAMRRITSYTTQHNACADAGSVDGSSSDTDSGSFSNDNSSSMLVSPPPTHALVVGDGLSRTASLDACFDDGRGVACKDEAVANRKDWAAWEDEAIRTGVHTIGTRWRQIAADLPGRSDDAVRNRWARLQHSLSGAKLPALPRVKRVEGVEQRQSWTEEEDEIISSSVRDFGHRWNRIAERLPRRTEHAIRNRWHRIQMREYEEKQGGAHHGAMPPSAQGLAMLAEMQAPPTTTPPTTAPPRAKPADATPTTAPHLAPSLTSASAASSSLM
ncbi:c-myb like protein [Chrysochromulina tobinii]|uniref:C-myb like protein n=1 Tax=Chrysochromulina tobinii TaxID=1460289 RepID=A0A0M0K099_9EUKA|nr:c-myb like protein [Chrysochromulina tobinii]|eukprot:KOO32235.1 c-myb like protein [Chrysochromulina sp. CCMP291]